MLGAHVLGSGFQLAVLGLLGPSHLKAAAVKTPLAPSPLPPSTCPEG